MPNSLIPLATSRGVGCLLASNPNLSFIDSLKDKSGIEFFNKSSILTVDSGLGEYLAAETSLDVELNLREPMNKGVITKPDGLSIVVGVVDF